MRNKLLGSLILMICYALTSSAQSLAPGKIETRWAKNVNASNVWQKYPRPQMVRSQWMNLNGLWDYAIIKKDNAEPKKYDGKILVPFCAESSLSGVEKSVLPDENLWYKRSFNIPTSWKGKKILLHFDAVDWETKVWLNGKLIGQHQGGSDPFTFDVSKYLKNGAQELTVSVWDPTDTGTQPRGKQQLSQKGIWYTPVTGIWQTVWLEPVESAYIERITPIADIDQNKVRLKNLINGAKGNESLSIKVMSNNKVIADQSFKVNSPIEITVPNPELWSPDHPFLYQLNVQLKRGNKVLDQIGSYFAMRKISIGKDKYGYERLLLNNEPKFQYGTLDQGWWPDGLLTPPSEEAMLYDMQILKDMGFNMLRKHIKVEPSRYYHDADSLGILIWQDMVTGFKTSEKATQHVQSGAKEDWQRPKNSADEFENEWKAIIDHLSFFPSIVTWVTFNEGWGQYDTKRIVEWTQKYDPSRVIDGVSGWEDRGVGNMIDTHQYPGPGMELASLNPGRVVVLGEFGGLGLPIQNHLWNPEMRNWGYRTYKSGKELVKEYAELIHNMYPMINRGLSAAVYTQTTDVEGEVNGLMTYDRDSIKIDPLFNEDFK